MEPVTEPRTAILDSIRQSASTASSLNSLQEEVVKFISQGLPHYDWVGFYMLDPNDPGTLVLGPFVGEPTLHLRIPVHQGICGAAVAARSTIVVDDVNSDPRYLSCSIKTRSEIVVPVFSQGKWLASWISTATRRRPSRIATAHFWRKRPGSSGATYSLTKGEGGRPDGRGEPWPVVFSQSLPAALARSRLSFKDLELEPRMLYSLRRFTLEAVMTRTLRIFSLFTALMLAGATVASAQHGGRGGGGGSGRSYSGGGGHGYSGGGRGYSGHGYSGGGHSYSGGGNFYSRGRGYSGGGNSYSRGRGYSGGGNSYSRGRGYSGGGNSYYGGRGYSNGRFYAGRGYYYGGRFWARPYYGYGIGIPFGWGYDTGAGCGYYDGWGYWHPAPCYAGDGYYYGR